MFGQVPNCPAVGTTPEYAFANQADIPIDARLAADALGATPKNCPEWAAVIPANGEVCQTLTNNNSTLRPVGGTNAAHPHCYVARNQPRFASSHRAARTPNVIRNGTSTMLSVTLAIIWPIIRLVIGNRP